MTCSSRGCNSTQELEPPHFRPLGVAGCIVTAELESEPPKSNFGVLIFARSPFFGSKLQILETIDSGASTLGVIYGYRSIAPGSPPPQEKISSGDIPNSPRRTSWNPGGTLVEPWWNPGGTLVEPWWNPRGTLPQGSPGPPRSLSWLRPQSCWGKKPGLLGRAIFAGIPRRQVFFPNGGRLGAEVSSSSILLPGQEKTCPESDAQASPFFVLVGFKGETLPPPKKKRKRGVVRMLFGWWT